MGSEGDEGDDETIEVLVDALPQLRALDLGQCAECATDAGLQACCMQWTDRFILWFWLLCRPVSM